MAYALENAKVLIVEDMRPMQLLLKSLLGIYGFSNVYTASSGEEGFNIFCRINPDLVVTDWIMDDGDGLAMIRRIRKDKKSPNPFVPVLVVTGFSSRPRVEKARDNGVTEFLVKPFTAKELYAKIEHVIEKPRQFVDNGEFFGPDRRRKRGEGYSGPRRRDGDSHSKPVRIEEEDARTRAAREVFRQLVEEARKTRMKE